jgi:hypothetical protein
LGTSASFFSITRRKRRHAAGPARRKPGRSRADCQCGSGRDRWVDSGQTGHSGHNPGTNFSAEMPIGSDIWTREGPGTPNCAQIWAKPAGPLLFPKSKPYAGVRRGTRPLQR